MPLTDFDHLLRDIRTAFGTDAWPEGARQPIRGRFQRQPFQVPLGGDAGLSVTQLWFFYDARHDLPVGVAAPRRGDFLHIDGERYEVADVQRDDLGEQGLQLLEAQRGALVTWQDGGAPVTWRDGSIAVTWR